MLLLINTVKHKIFEEVYSGLAKKNLAYTESEYWVCSVENK
jgi:hypothetical protein